jgi:hypothetical protein
LLRQAGLAGNKNGKKKYTKNQKKEAQNEVTAFPV